MFICGWLDLSERAGKQVYYTAWIIYCHVLCCVFSVVLLGDKLQFMHCHLLK